MNHYFNAQSRPRTSEVVENPISMATNDLDLYTTDKDSKWRSITRFYGGISVLLKD